jgi:hypothetical protein
VLDKFYANNPVIQVQKLTHSIENYCKTYLNGTLQIYRENTASQVTTVGSSKNILFVNSHRGPGGRTGLFIRAAQYARCSI